jgi:hypothetical protein
MARKLFHPARMTWAPVRFSKRQRPQYDRIHDTEDRCIGGNGKRDGQDHNRRERWRAAHHAERVANIVQHAMLVSDPSYSALGYSLCRRGLRLK